MNEKGIIEQFSWAMPEVECIHGALMTFPDVPSPTIGSKTTRPNFALNVALDLASPNGATTAVTVDTSSALGMHTVLVQVQLLNQVSQLPKHTQHC